MWQRVACRDSTVPRVPGRPGSATRQRDQGGTGAEPLKPQIFAFPNLCRLRSRFPRLCRLLRIINSPAPLGWRSQPRKDPLSNDPDQVLPSQGLSSRCDIAYLIALDPQCLLCCLCTSAAAIGQEQQRTRVAETPATPLPPHFNVGADLRVERA